MLRLVLFILFPTLVLPILLHGQCGEDYYPHVPSPTEFEGIPDSMNTRFRDDAMTLAMEWIGKNCREDEERVTPPEALITSLHNALIRCYQYATPPVRSIMEGRHPGVDGDSALTIYIDMQVARWGSAWMKGKESGDSLIDYWTRTLGLRVVESEKLNRKWTRLVIASDRRFNADPLYSILARTSGLRSTNPEPPSAPESKPWQRGGRRAPAPTALEMSREESQRDREPFFRQDVDSWVFNYRVMCSNDRTWGCGATFRVMSSGEVSMSTVF